jgi:hypothetical protein
MLASSAINDQHAEMLHSEYSCLNSFFENETIASSVASQ